MMSIASSPVSPACMLVKSVLEAMLRCASPPTGCACAAGAESASIMAAIPDVRVMTLRMRSFPLARCTPMTRYCAHAQAGSPCTTCMGIYLLSQMGKKMHQKPRNTALIAFCALILGGLLLPMIGCKSNISDKKIQFIDLTRAVELYEQQQKEDDTALFIDARRPERFVEGHIPGARNMRTPDVDLRYGTDPALERYKHLIVYGENPGTASINPMAKRLIEVGYNGFVKKRVKVFPGGWEEWEITGLPIEREEPKDEGDE